MQYGDAGQQMQHMHKSQDVEKRAIGIGGQIQTLCAQLLPRHILADAERNPQHQREQQPHRPLTALPRIDLAATDHVAPGNLDRSAAAQQQEGVEIKDRGQNDVPPVR